MASWSKCAGAGGIMELVSQPYRLRFKLYGISHGLKTCHRHVFAPVCVLVPPFRFPLRHNEKTPVQKHWSLFMVNDGARNTNTMS